MRPRRRQPTKLPCGATESGAACLRDLEEKSQSEPSCTTKLLMDEYVQRLCAAARRFHIDWSPTRTEEQATETRRWKRSRKGVGRASRVRKPPKTTCCEMSDRSCSAVARVCFIPFFLVSSHQRTSSHTCCMCP